VIQEESGKNVCGTVANAARVSYLWAVMQATKTRSKPRKSAKRPPMTSKRLIENAQTAKAPPKGLPAAIEALWWDIHGDAAKALGLVENEPGLNSVWVRAYLRRKKGDESIAAYWYAKAIRPTATGSHIAERDLILRVLLGEN